MIAVEVQIADWVEYARLGTKQQKVDCRLRKKRRPRRKIVFFPAPT